MGRGVPLPNRLGVWGSVVSSHRGVEFGAFAARRTLIPIIRIFVSAVMDVKTHTAKHEQQKCDHVYTHTHTPYTRAFFQMINLQSAGCGQARGVKPKAERRGGT